MRYLSSLRGPTGALVGPNGVFDLLRAIEDTMFSRGWTVIGSVFKVSCLHPWKRPTREEVHQWAQKDLGSGRANALNLRLSDTQTIALDCDFTDPVLMARFMSLLQLRLGLHKEQLFTCAGKKGGKIFFRFMPLSICDQLPRTLGPKVFLRGHSGDSAFKQELEVKSDLSTVAGLYGLPDPVSYETIVYGPYEDFPYIVDAAPSDLPTITSVELQSLGDLLGNLVKQGDYEDAEGHLFEPSFLEHEFMRSCVVLCICMSYYALQQAQGRQDVTFAEAKQFAQQHDVVQQEFLPFLCFMGQGLTYELIEHVLFDKPLRSPLLEADAAELHAAFTTDSVSADHANRVSNAYSVFLNSTSFHHQLLMIQSAKNSLPAQPILELCKELRDKVWSNNAST